VALCTTSRSGHLRDLQLEFDLNVLAALLAILGYSLNDTVVIYDRIRETLKLHTKHDLFDVLNRSLNETLSRTLLTAGTTFIAVLALLLVGGDVIRPFALAMLIGIVVGSYSSLYIAAPVLLYLETRWGGAGGDGERSAPRRGTPRGATRVPRAGRRRGPASPALAGAPRAAGERRLSRAARRGQAADAPASRLRCQPSSSGWSRSAMAPSATTRRGATSPSTMPVA
jgi:hypothetical protein